MPIKLLSLRFPSNLIVKVLLEIFAKFTLLIELIFAPSPMLNYLLNAPLFTHRHGLIHIQAEGMEDMFHQCKKPGVYYITQFTTALTVPM